jgi:uncharacterized protein (TIGR02145 family)
MKIRLLFLLSIGLTRLQAQTVEDVDGNVYNIKTIGSQTWMQENLNVVHYRNGDLISTTADTTSICSENTPKYQWAYNSKEDLLSVHGRLYTWYVVSDNRKICPIGWHVPSISEWMILKKNLGLDTLTLNDSLNFNHISSIINKNRFSNQTEMIRNCSGLYKHSIVGIWWSSNDDGELSTKFNFLPLIALKTVGEEKNGFSVRCIKD